MIVGFAPICYLCDTPEMCVFAIGPDICSIKMVLGMKFLAPYMEHDPYMESPKKVIFGEGKGGRHTQHHNLNPVLCTSLCSTDGQEEQVAFG